MHKKRLNNQGMALLAALFFSAIAIMLISALTLRLLGQRTHVNQYVAYIECFNGLESAYSQSKISIETGGDGMVGISGWPSPQGTLTLPDFSSAGVSPLSLTALPDVQYFAFAHTWGNDGIDNTGDGVVDGVNEQWTYTIYSWARNASVSRRSEAILRGSDVNVWRNAIFAGNGQAGGVINGNVSIHGSVHILGGHVPAGGTAITALDLSGTSLIHNNYDGCPADLQARVPPLPQVLFNAEMVESIEAKLRVKRGLVGVSGNSEIGAPDLFGNNVKETLDGTFVSDGWTGNKTIDDGGRGIPEPVFSDNGHTELYDLGDRVSFPLLSDEWRAPVTGERVWNADTNAWYTHEEYFTEVLLADPIVKTDGIHSGDIDIFTRGGHFYWNATTGEKLVGSLPVTPPAATDDYLLFNEDTDVLRINGQLVVDGNFVIRGQGNQMTVNYTGRGAILVNGNATLDTSLLSCNNGNPADVANSFPANNFFGIMAAGDMYVGTAAQISLMGAFYAQNRIICAKQTNVMGTFVASYFDMGTNVPSIYQVPTLADNLPLGMIGNYPILSLGQISWRELGVQL